MDFEEMQKEIIDLKRQVQELREKLSDMSFLEEDYSKDKVFRRSVVFKEPVYNASGTKIIN